MKAITLWQPFATLWAARVKLNETRGFATKHRGVTAIHAAKADYAALWDLVGDDQLLALERVCREHGLPPIACLPRGAFVGITSIEKVCRVEWETGHGLGSSTRLREVPPVGLGFSSQGITSLELSLGDYETSRNTRKRYAWASGERSALFAEPIPCRGQQGLWDVPEMRLDAVLEAGIRAGFYRDENGGA